MENKKNADTVKLLFKIKKVEKQLPEILHQLKILKCKKISLEDYNRCFTIYNEASSHFYQSTGFIKAQYFESSFLPISKTYLLNDLFYPSYKNFLLLRQSLGILEVEDVYSDTLKQLKESADIINISLSEILSDLSLS